MLTQMTIAPRLRAQLSQSLRHGMTGKDYVALPTSPSGSYRANRPELAEGGVETVLADCPCINAVLLTAFRLQTTQSTEQSTIHDHDTHLVRCALYASST